MTTTGAFEGPTIPAPAPIQRPREATAYGHYLVERRPDGSPWVLGRGGMGVTIKAVDTNLRCPVALKIISPECFGGEHSQHRFVREAQFAAQIRHPNVAAIHHLDCQDGQFFYAMEFVDGITADAWVRKRGVMSLELALDIIMQVSRALTAADRLRVVHRDIKPGNIMILPDPANGSRVIVKLIDFGLARSVATEASPTATTCGFTGTPQFASPEQAENLELDIRSDIYSLGATFWYLLVGAAPFTGTPARVIAQLLTADPPWESVKHLPKQVTRLLRVMLAKDPGGRPQNPVVLHNLISACRESLSVHAALPKPPVGLRRNAFFRYGLRSAAFAGVLCLVLVWLALSPRSHEESGAAPAVIRPMPSLSSSGQSSIPDGATAANPATLMVAQSPVGGSAEPSSSPPLAPSGLDLTRFEHPPQVFSLDQEGPDSATAANLNNQHPVSLQLAGLDSSEPLAYSPEAPPVNSPEQHGIERRRGNKQRHPGTSQTFDRIRGSVEGLIHHIF